MRNIRVFIGFINYYRRSIVGFSKLALLLTILTYKTPGLARSSLAIRREESQKLELRAEVIAAF